MTSSGDDFVTRIDPSTGVRRQIDVGDEPEGVAVGAGAVWVANAGDGTVSRIDPATRRVVKTIEVGNSPFGIVVAARARLGDGAGAVRLALQADRREHERGAQEQHAAGTRAETSVASLRTPDRHDRRGIAGELQVELRVRPVACRAAGRRPPAHQVEIARLVEAGEVRAAGGCASSSRLMYA